MSRSIQASYLMLPKQIKNLFEILRRAVEHQRRYFFHFSFFIMQYILVSENYLKKYDTLRNVKHFEIFFLCVTYYTYTPIYHTEVNQD